MLQKFNLVNDIFVHNNRQFYFQLSRKIINEVCMLIIFFRVVIVKSKSQSSIKVIGYLVLLSDVVECIHFFLQFSSFNIQTRKNTRQTTNSKGESDNTNNQQNESKDSKKLLKMKKKLTILLES